MEKKNKNFLFNMNEYVICCFILLVPKVIMILTAAYPITNGDELSIFAIPAKLAGLDWTSSMYYYRYYGYGFSLFLTPLFKIIHNPIVLYRFILVLVVIVQLVIPIICCYLLHTFFYVENKLQIVLISTICIYGESMFPTYMYNEHLYITCVWISYLVLSKLWKLSDKNKRERVLYSFFLGLSFVGALTVHQRAVTLFLACIILYFFMMLLCKKRIFYISPIIVVYMLGDYINTKIMSYFIKLIKYDSIDGGRINSELDLSKIQNTSVDMKFSLTSFGDKEYMQAIARVLMGNLNNLNIFTVGIAFFAIVLGIYFLLKLYKKEISIDEQKLLYFGVFGMACMLITIIGIANTWGWGIEYAYVNNESSYDSLRGLTYTRYYIAYFPPLMLGVLAYICNHTQIYTRLFHYTILLSGTCMYYYLGKIAPLMKYEKVGFGSLGIYTPYAYKRDVLPCYYLCGAIVFLCLMVGLYYLLKNKKIYIYLMIICCSFLWRCTYLVYLRPTKDINYRCADQSRIILDRMEEENINIPVYVSTSMIRETDQAPLLCEVQFMNMRTKLERGYPEEELEEAIFITIYPKEDMELLDKGYTCLRLDEEEYMYVKGEYMVQFIHNCLME